MKTRKDWIVRVAVLLGAAACVSCGVNPDRMAAIEARNARLAEEPSDEGEEEVALEYSDSDPAPIRNAIASVKSMRDALKASDNEAYLSRRSEVVGSLFGQRTELQDHPKYDRIFDAVERLDAQFAKPAGDGAVERVRTERTLEASADARYAVKDALDSCERAFATNDQQLTEQLFSAYKSNLERARGIDAKALSFRGKRADGTGFLDVPVATVWCDLRMAIREVEAADQPPAAPDQSETYTGCGYFQITLEAAQVGADRFGDYELVGPGSTGSPDAVPHACDKIPPTTDAPTAVVRAVRSGATWLQEGDILSMSGPFDYEQRSAGTLVKKGEVRIYRRDTTLKTNRCGSEDSGTTCEAEGSDVARAFNHATHFMERAQLHRSEGRADRCREMADRAYKAVNKPMANPDADAKILVRGGQTMSPTQINARIEALKSEANDVLASDWCTQP